MAVLTINSVQYGNRDSNPPVPNKVYEVGGKLRFAYFTFDQGLVAGDANSLQNLCRIPAGTGRIIKMLSRIQWTALGAGRTLDIGWLAFKNSDGTAVAADIDGIADGIDVSSAGQQFLGTGTGAAIPETLEYDSTTEITIQSKVLGDTIPASDTFDGWICYISN